MAAGVIPKPTTGSSRAAPCAPDCHRWTLRHRPSNVIPEGQSHTDCAELRRMAASACRLCSQPIGYETPFYQDPQQETALVHARCLEDATHA